MTLKMYTYLTLWASYRYVMCTNLTQDRAIIDANFGLLAYSQGKLWSIECMYVIGCVDKTCFCILDHILYLNNGQININLNIGIS